MKYIKIYLVRLIEIFKDFKYFKFSFCVHYIWFWIISLRFNLSKSNILYEKKRNKYILNWLDIKYGKLFPHNFSCKQEIQNINFQKLPIWVCWLQGKKNMPDIVQTCYKSIKNNANNRPVFFISIDNIEEYIDIPQYLKDKLNAGYIKYANYTDILRLMLLYKYGGTWIDATVYLSSILDDKWRNPLFSSIKLNPHNRQYTISKYKWATFYLFAYPKSPAIECSINILLSYWKDGYKKTIDYFLIDYVFELLYNKNSDFRKCIDTTPFHQEGIYELEEKLNSQYKEGIKIFGNKTNIHKLNWRTKIKEGNTVYNYLKKCQKF